MNQPKKILIVDDGIDVEPMFRQHFVSEIGQGLLELKFAFYGDEALKTLRSQGSFNIADGFFTKPVDFSQIRSMFSKLNG